MTVQKTFDDILSFLSICLFQSVIRCLWHPKLNQIMVGTGNGLAKVYYDPVKSHRYVQFIALQIRLVLYHLLFINSNFPEETKTNS